MDNRMLIIEGDNYDDALKQGLLQLNLSKEEVDVEIIEEKKGFLFKKASTKLKITPKKEMVGINDIEVFEQQQESILLNINQLSPKKYEKRVFQLSYQDDGVYLIVFSNHQMDQSLIEEILEVAKKKQIKDLDSYQVTQAVEQKEVPIKIAPPQGEVLVDSSLRVNLSRDRMEAKILVTKAEGGKAFTLDSLKGELAQNSVTYGINEEILARIVDLEETDDYVPIAKGKAPINGLDAQAIYHFDTTKGFKPNINEDGTVDFKQLNIIRNVSKGELLVEVIPPTEGVQGIDVTGNMISAKKGKEIKIKKGKNTVHSEDGLKLYAAVNGQILIEDGKISISEIYQVSGDVDNSTGNIQFNGTVVVNGNVKSGFMIQANGNIEVNGVVEGATLIAKGNIVLNRGIQGNNQALLECGGNLVVKYVENAKIKCRGNIDADFILHSDVVTKGKITLNGKKGLVAGGDIRAGEEIRAKTIGSHMGTSTRLEVGIDPEERVRFEELKNELIEIEKSCHNLKKTIDLLSRAAKTGQMPKSKEEIYIKSLKTYEFLKEKQVKLKGDLQLAEEKINGVAKGKIHVSDLIYPGVKVVILNSTRFFYDELSNCTLYRKDGEVVIGPYER